MSKAANPEVEALEVGTGQGGFGGEDFYPEGGWGSALPATPQHAYLTGILMGVLAIGMFFLALTSAFIVRKGSGGDWQSFALPRILWLNTAVLIASSFTLARARRRLLNGYESEFRRWWHITTVLGIAFLAGQLVAWRELAHAGLYLASNPSSSFFYLLTGAHGLHLLGGVCAFFYVAWLGTKAGTTRRVETASRITAVYWHFLDGLWVFVLLLLLLGR